MSYIGKAPGFGIRNRYYYTATSTQTLFSGADDNGQTLAYADSKYLDVYLNGVLLVAGTDYTATTLTSVSLTTGAAASDIVEIVAYDIFSVADTVSAANGGTFNGAITIDGGLSVDGGTIKLDGNYPVGTNNVALGDAALDALTTGNYNTAVGHGSLTTNTSGNFNTGFGRDTLGLNSTGSNNVAMGQGSLYNNTASNNTAVGYNSLYANTTGSENTAVGFGSLDAVTTATRNTAIGTASGTSLTTGVQNTLIGDNAGSDITTGAANTIIGRYNGNQGGLDIRTANNNIVLSDGAGNPRAYIDTNGVFVFPATGYNTSYNITNAGTHSRYVIHNIDSSNGSGFTYNIFQHGGTGYGSISFTGSGVAFNTSSDYRLKENLVDLTGAIDRVKQLKPLQFNFINNPDMTVDGFIAHEVADVVPEAITGEKDAVDENGDPKYQGIDQSKLVPLLTAALKEAITEIESLKARVQALESN